MFDGESPIFIIKTSSKKQVESEPLVWRLSKNGQFYVDNSGSTYGTVLRIEEKALIDARRRDAFKMLSEYEEAKKKPKKLTQSKKAGTKKRIGHSRYGRGGGTIPMDVLESKTTPRGLLGSRKRKY